MCTGMRNDGHVPTQAALIDCLNQNVANFENCSPCASRISAARINQDPPWIRRRDSRAMVLLRQERPAKVRVTCAPWPRGRRARCVSPDRLLVSASAADGATARPDPTSCSVSLVSGELVVVVQRPGEAQLRNVGQPTHAPRTVVQAWSLSGRSNPRQLRKSERVTQPVLARSISRASRPRGNSRGDGSIVISPGG